MEIFNGSNIECCSAGYWLDIRFPVANEETVCHVDAACAVRVRPDCTRRSGCNKNGAVVREKDPNISMGNKHPGASTMEGTDARFVHVKRMASRRDHSEVLRKREAI